MRLATRIPDYPFVEFQDDVHHGPYYVVPFKLSMWEEERSDRYLLTRVGAEVAYWVRKRKDEVLHSLDGGLQTLDDYNSKVTNTNHRVYLTSEKAATSFKSLLKRIANINQRRLFASLDGFVDDMEIDDAREVVIYRFETEEKITSKMLALWFWTRDNCTGKVWRYGDNVLVFEKSEDAITFKMKFGGTQEEK
jgi:hypothetical protein